MTNEIFNSKTVVYSQDESPEHCGTIVYKSGEHLNAISLHFDEDSDKWRFEQCNFYEEVEDWMEIHSLNSYCDASHKPGKLTQDEQILLTVDVISYWGAQSSGEIWEPMDENELARILKVRDIIL